MNAARRLGSALLFGLLVVAPRGVAAAEPSRTPIEGSLRRGVEWLLSQQDADGGWRSSTYGSMRGGAGDTALALYALTLTPEPSRAAATPPIDRGLRFLLSNLDGDGFVRAADDSSDYPTYATALALTALQRRGVDKWQEQRQRMRSFLLNSQQRGGWPLTGGYDLPDDTPTVSTTRFALEALRASGGLDGPTQQAAQEFLARCQNAAGDGGFFFTPLNDHPLNKAGGSEADGAQSYGTATADGLLALLASGAPPDDARVQAAARWLLRHKDIEVVPGFTGAVGETASAEEGLRYYYYAALASVIRQTPQFDWEERRDSLVAAILREQSTDGSWRNPVATMREDDPLVATPLAIVALSGLLDDRRPPSGD